MMKKDKKIFARERHYCPYSKNTTCDGWGCGEDCIFHPDFMDEPDCDVCHFNKKNRDFEKRKLRFQQYWEADDKPFIMKKIPENINPARFAMSGTRTEELPECPYVEDVVCECIEQGLCNGECKYHPDYEEYEYEEEIEKYLTAYDEGYQQGYKKAYIAAMEEADEWLEDENEDFDGYGVGSLDDWDEPTFPPDFSNNYDRNNGLKEYHPCERVRNYVSGLSPCVDCDYDECPVPDGDDNLFESIEEAYDCGFSQGLDCGYIEGYKDGFMEEQPQIEDADIEEMIKETEEIRSPYKDANNFYVMGYKDCFLGDAPKITDAELDRCLENKSGE